MSSVVRVHPPPQRDACCNQTVGFFIPIIISPSARPHETRFLTYKTTTLFFAKNQIFFQTKNAVLKNKFIFAKNKRHEMQHKP